MSFHTLTCRLRDLEEDCPALPTPTGWKIELMAHQKTALWAMKALEQEGRVEVTGVDYYKEPKMTLALETQVGILADRVGAGKTLMALALVQTQPQPPRRERGYLGSRYLTMKNLSPRIYRPQTLIIVPAKLLPQWTQQLDHLPHLRVRSLSTASEVARFAEEELEQYDLFILADKVYARWEKRFSDSCWARIMIDEADTIQLGTADLTADFLWLITATPQKLGSLPKYRNLSVFNAQFSWVPSQITVSNTNRFIDQAIQLPAPERITVPCLCPPELEVIKKYIPASVIQLIHAGDPQSAIQKLNCNLQTQDSMIKVVTQQMETQIENLNLEVEYLQKKKVRGKHQQKHQKQQIQELQKQTTRTHNRLVEIRKKLQEMDQKICTVCMGGLEKPVMLQCCHNFFCFECLMISTENSHSCPLCRSQITQDQMVMMQEDLPEEGVPRREKLKTLIHLLDQKPEGRFLVFSNFAQTFARIQEQLTHREISYRELKGSANQVQKTIQDFQEGKIRVLMLNTRYYGAGLNLQMATDVVLFHRFHPLLEEQVIGRAQRFGRTDPLRIYYLLHPGEETDLTSVRISGEEVQDLDYLEWLAQEEPEEKLVPEVKIQQKELYQRPVLAKI